MVIRCRMNVKEARKRLDLIRSNLAQVCNHVEHLTPDLDGFVGQGMRGWAVKSANQASPLFVAVHGKLVLDS